MDDIELTPVELKAIAALKRVAKRWPKTLWLFAGPGGLSVLRCSEDGGHVHAGEGVDQDHVVDHIDIDADGGDW